MTHPATPAVRGGPPPLVLLLALGGLVVMVAYGIVLLVGGAGDGSGGSAGPGGAAPTPAPASAAVRQTAGLVSDALGRSSIQVVEPQTPYRPAESPTLFSAPRLVLQAVLPDDPTGGHLVIYELPTAGGAAEAGAEYAAYLASGVGRVQFPGDTRFVIRRVGTTLVFFAWSPAASPDERTADVAAALETVGEGVPVPS